MVSNLIVSAPIQAVDGPPSSIISIINHRENDHNNNMQIKNIQLEKQPHTSKGPNFHTWKGC